MTPTQICLAWLRALLRRSILEDREHCRDLERLIRKVAQADAAEKFAEMERMGVKLPNSIDWENFPF